MEVAEAIQQFRQYQQILKRPTIFKGAALEELFNYLAPKVKAMTGSNLIAQDYYAGYRAGRKHVLIYLNGKDLFDVYINGKLFENDVFVDDLLPCLEESTGYYLRLR